MLMRRATASASDEKRTARQLAAKAECPTDYSEAMLTCMQNIPAEGMVMLMYTKIGNKLIFFFVHIIHLSLFSLSLSRF